MDAVVQELLRVRQEARLIATSPPPTRSAIASRRPASWWRTPHAVPAGSWLRHRARCSDGGQLRPPWRGAPPGFEEGAKGRFRGQRRKGLEAKARRPRRRSAPGIRRPARLAATLRHPDGGPAAGGFARRRHQRSGGGTQPGRRGAAGATACGPAPGGRPDRSGAPGGGGGGGLATARGVPVKERPKRELDRLAGSSSHQGLRYRPSRSRMPTSTTSRQRGSSATGPRPLTPRPRAPQPRTPPPRSDECRSAEAPPILVAN